MGVSRKSVCARQQNANENQHAPVGRARVGEAGEREEGFRQVAVACERGGREERVGEEGGGMREERGGWRARERGGRAVSRRSTAALSLLPQKKTKSNAPTKDATLPRPGSGIVRVSSPVSNDRSSRAEHTLRSQHTTRASPFSADAHCSRSAGCWAMTSAHVSGEETWVMSVRSRLGRGRGVKEHESGQGGVSGRGSEGGNSPGGRRAERGRHHPGALVTPTASFFAPHLDAPHAPTPAPFSSALSTRCTAPTHRFRGAL
jgi:hypothetical protein